MDGMFIKYGEDRQSCSECCWLRFWWGSYVCTSLSEGTRRRSGIFSLGDRIAPVPKDCPEKSIYSGRLTEDDKKATPKNYGKNY